MYYNYSLLRNQKAVILRYGERVFVDGLAKSPEITLIVLYGSIQPASSLVNLKKKYGDETLAGISFFSTVDNKLNIVRGKMLQDVIFYRDDFWTVRSSIVHDLILPHSRAEATLMTHPPKELLDLKPDAQKMV